METLLQDVRFASRSLLKRPGFSFIVILTLAVGIGANTAIFSVVNAVLLRPLPYREPSQLVTVLHEGWKPVAPANFLDWREQSHAFETLAGAQLWGPNLSGTDRPETVKALQMTADMFRLLGVQPAHGRTFVDGEDQPGNDHVVVLSDGIWNRKFGADKQIIGQRITLDGEGYTVIGVMPPQFQFAPFWATGSEMWVPLNLGARLQDRRGQSLRVFGRLKPGVTRAQAQTEMETISRRLEQEYCIS
jgi:putative ABC transport system permease protein